MLTKEIEEKIIDFIKEEPKSIYEIARLIGKSWRTTDKYVNYLTEKYEEIKIKVFRKGSRGALKVVFWKSILPFSSEIKEWLYRKIENGREKVDFSPFEIFQFANTNKKIAFIHKGKFIMGRETPKSFKRVISLLDKAENEVLSFSGNFSWINLSYKNLSLYEKVKELVERGVKIFAIGRIDVDGRKNIEKLLNINFETKTNLIKVKHIYQPLRGFIIDNKVARFREIKDPKKYMKDELKQKILIFYEIYDKEWIDFLRKTFWRLFRVGVDARKRIEEIEKMKIVKE
ncbi:MAG: hypothetical protein B6U78_01900 [Candidatus Aenigmarchaeota archaeon ex4484_224]|nr:MAG: hypothetical protein B6U78_01900 [Candidatus Aenigmarchaeota archaeon ex4484_224]